jgi:hypothetical protein
MGKAERFESTSEFFVELWRATNHHAIFIGGPRLER